MQIFLSTRSVSVWALRVLALAGVLAASAACAPRASAQVSVGVDVDATKDLSIVPQNLVGLNVSIADSKLSDNSVPDLLKSAGIRILRFPGGGAADDYHWKTNSVISGSSVAVDSNNSFDSFAALAKKAAATPLITVDYGSNADGSEGGDPQEAADWVRYANISKHDAIKYWEVGNEVFGNGFYGKEWETDLHVPAAAKRKGSFHLAPRTYGSNVNLYVRAMKAVDPSIKVGAVLALPGDFPTGWIPIGTVQCCRAAAATSILSPCIFMAREKRKEICCWAQYNHPVGAGCGPRSDHQLLRRQREKCFDLRHRGRRR